MSRTTTTTTTKREHTMGRRTLARIMPPAAAPPISVKVGECSTHGVAIGQCGCSSGVPLPPNTITPGPGCYPQSAVDVQSGRFASPMYAEALRNSRMAKTPYTDPYYDAVFMDTIYTDPVEIAPAVAGAFTNIELQPVAGTFAMYYWSISVVDPATGVAQTNWRVRQPRIENCPVPCQGSDRDILPAFVAKIPEACCGQPLAAWLDAPANDTPLVIPFRNDQAAGNLLVQVQARGYCCNRRLC